MMLAQSYPQEATRVLSYTIPWKETSFLNFLQAFPNETRLYVENGHTSVAVGGIGSVVTLHASGEDRFHSIRKQCLSLFERIDIIKNADSAPPPLIIGGAAFDPKFQPHGIWSGFASASFVLPRISLVRSHGEHWLTFNEPIKSDHTRDEILAHFAAQTISLKSSIASKRSALQGSLLPDRSRDHTSIPIRSLNNWRAMLETAIAHIHGGEIDKVVLSRALKFIGKEAIAPLAVLEVLEDQYPDCYRFLVEFVPGNAFFGATPELLASVRDGWIRAMALAGSAPRGKSPDEDEALGHELLANAKERQEHNLVIRQIKNNLAPLTSSLAVSPAPALMQLNNIQHIRTDISGELNDDHDLLSVVAALHPTPAVGGNPRPRALDLIAELETQSRGWYAAPIGWMDAAGNGEFVVGLRSGVSLGNEALLYSGAGILGASNPDREWDETERKFRPMLNALQRSHSHDSN